MQTETDAKLPLNINMVRGLVEKIKEKENELLVVMDFPTLDDMEMDVPTLNASLGQARLSPEDDEDLELQYMLHFDPTQMCHLAH